MINSRSCFGIISFLKLGINYKIDILGVYAMAIILKEGTFLRKKEDETYYMISNINQRRNYIAKQQGVGKGGIKVLLKSWKRFAILCVLIFLAKGVSEDLFFLSLFVSGITVILTMGYTKRDYEAEDQQLIRKAQRIKSAFKPWEKGLKGETAIFKTLSRLSDDFYIINDISINFKIEVQIDHVVVGPTGIFAIETKSMGGNLKPFKDNWLHGPNIIRSPQLQSKRGASVLASLLDEKVQAIVALSNSKARWLGEQEELCPVIYGVQLNTYIISQSVKVLNPKDIAYKIMRKLYNSETSEDKRQRNFFKQDYIDFQKEMGIVKERKYYSYKMFVRNVKFLGIISSILIIAMLVIF